MCWTREGTPLHEAIVCENTEVKVIDALLKADEALGNGTRRATLLSRRRWFYAATFTDSKAFPVAYFELGRGHEFDGDLGDDC